MIFSASSKRGLPFFLLSFLSLLAPALLFMPGDSQAATCDGFYSPGFKLAEGKLNPAVPPLAKPAKGVRVQEPNFKTCLFRATDHRTEPSDTYSRIDYSRRQAFNANSTYFITYSNDGSWHLYDANTLKHLRVLTPLAGDAEPQWHPTDPNTLYYLPIFGGTKILKVDVRTNASSTAVDFQGKLPSWAAGATNIWTKSEGSPSADGRYWGMLVYGANWKLLGHIMWDMQQNKLVGSRQTSAEADNVSASASGRWLVASDANGVWAWSADFSQKMKIDQFGGIHSDLAFGPQGHDYFVSVDYESDDGEVYAVDLDTCPTVAASSSSAAECPRIVLFSMYTIGSWGTMHFSGKAFKKPGWVLISTYDVGSKNGTPPWYTDKVFAIELKSNPRIYPIAYTRRADSESYWAEPHATVNRDFTRIAFNSNWGNGSGEDIDAYMVEIPSNAFGNAPTLSAPPTGGRLPPEKSANYGVAGKSAALSPTSGVLPSGGERTSIGCVLCQQLNQSRKRLSTLGAQLWHAGNAAILWAKNSMAHHKVQATAPEGMNSANADNEATRARETTDTLPQPVATPPETPLSSVSGHAKKPARNRALALKSACKHQPRGVFDSNSTSDPQLLMPVAFCVAAASSPRQSSPKN